MWRLEAIVEEQAREGELNFKSEICDQQMDSRHILEKKLIKLCKECEENKVTSSLLNPRYLTIQQVM